MAELGCVDGKNVKYDSTIVVGLRVPKEILLRTDEPIE